MAFKLPNRVLQTSTTTGTGTYNLDGAAGIAFNDFDDELNTGDTTYYCVTDETSGGWEAGIGTFTSGTPDTLARTTILGSSNGGSAVNWGAGTRNVFVGAPGEAFNSLLDTGSNGIIAQTTARTYARRTITVSGPGISIANGNGVSGNPALTLALIPSSGATMMFRNNTAPTGWTQNTSLQLGSVFRLVNDTAGGSGGSVDVNAGNFSLSGWSHSHTVNSHQHVCPQDLPDGVGGGANGPWCAPDPSKLTNSASPGTDSVDPSGTVSSNLYYNNAILCDKDA